MNKKITEIYNVFSLIVGMLKENLFQLTAGF